ncbi:MAG: hypothetical protein HC927_07260 [Deltaproteobacteria bacterium]|nr:hypothetical protein [Deltaproteobacteria bacterium]
MDGMILILDASDRFQELMLRLKDFEHLLRRFEAMPRAMVTRDVDLGAGYLQRIDEVFGRDMALAVRTAIADRKRAATVLAQLEEQDLADRALSHERIGAWWAATMASVWGLNVLSASILDPDMLPLSSASESHKLAFVEDMIRRGAADSYNIIRFIQMP